MRQILSILLTSTFVVPITPVSAQDVDSVPTLEKRLHNMDAEVERFLSLKATESTGCRWGQEGDESFEVERVRTILLNLKPDSYIVVVLRDGSTAQGRFKGANDKDFSLQVELGESSRELRKYRFDQVTRLDYPGSPLKAHQILNGKRVEVLLLSGEKVRGRLLDTSEGIISLSTGKDTNREFRFAEVFTVRKLGMRTAYKVLIGGSIAFLALVITTAALVSASGGV
jgi:small nuclear ribonucleoprotein (snRNP)-like protein